MQVHLPEATGRDWPLRARLLGRALAAHLRARGHELLPPAPRRTGRAALADLARRAALPAQAHAVRAASLGLGLPAALERGPALLLLVRSLAAELDSFAGEAIDEADGDAVPDLLRGYHRALLVDRADVAETVGFAPWLPVALADRFPVTVPPPAPARDPKLLILDHGAPPGQAQALLRRLSGLGPAVILARGQEAAEGALAADLHLHLGHAPDGAVVALSPFDSLAAGVYTLVLPAEGRKPDAALREAAAARSYVDVAESLPALEARARAMLARWATVRAAGQDANPETARYAAQNAAWRAARLARFDTVLARDGVG